MTDNNAKPDAVEADESEEVFFTVGDLKKEIADLPDDMEVTGIVILPTDGEGSEDSEEKTQYIPITGIEDLTDEETGEKSLGLVIDLEDFLSEDEAEEDEEPLDQDNNK